MDKQTLDTAKQRLLTEQKRLRAELAETGTKSVHGKESFPADYPSIGTDQDENAQEVSAYEDRLGIEKDLETSLKAVDAALAKIDDGTYGTCQVCRKEIAKERLAALPAVSTCADHAAAAGA